MRSLKLVAMLCLALLATQFAAAVRTSANAGSPRSTRAEAPRFQSAEEILAWINNYRFDPEPKRLPAAVHDMSRLGLLRDSDTAGVYIGFAAGILASEPDDAGTLVAAMFPLPPEDQALVIKSIAYSGLPAWKQLLTGFIEQMPARRKLINKLLFGKEPVLDAAPLETSPAVIDALWGFYFATGAERPIVRIVGGLAWAGDKSDVAKLTIGSTAKWTLASNATRDRHLLQLLRDLSVRGGQTDETVKELKDVIEAAESYETNKIRKDALAAIDELKRKGPAKEWSWTSFGIQSAPTVVALGCVAATVSGQAEIGIPCVLTGALSSAAAKLWSASP